MGIQKFDFSLAEEKREEKNDVTLTVNLPRDLKVQLLKLPSKPRNKKIVEMLKALVKENAS